jgi:uroporphyrinogen III methyltransferase / synthase
VSENTEKPLVGQLIMVTRPRGESKSLCDRLAALGAETIVQPAIAIIDPPDWRPVDAALARLEQYDWLVFSSVHGARYFMDRRLSLQYPPEMPSTLKVAAVGAGTAEELAKYNIVPDIIPAEYRAESLADALRAEVSARRFLLARGSRGRELLADELTAAGRAVEQIVVYSSRDVAAPEGDVAELLAAGRINWITVTSSAIARSLAAMFGQNLKKAKLASISPLTSAALREKGFDPSVEAAEYSMDGLIAALVKTLRP